MTQETHQEKKTEEKEHLHKHGEHHHEHEHTHKEPQEHKIESAKAHEEKKEGKKEAPQRIPKVKKEAIARGLSLPISKKHSIYICSFIKNKNIDKAINDLEKVINYKKIIPFRGEIPHRKGMMSGRYPIKASAQFIKLLKGLKGNAIMNGLDLDKVRINFASATWDSRPLRREGRKAKRTHVLLKADEVMEK